MKQIPILIICLLCLTVASTFAQKGDGAVSIKEEFVPGATYEIRYWTNMARMGDDQVYIDTMMFFGDRAVFEYSNAECVSYHCRSSDSLVYVLLPKFSTSEKEWMMGNNFVKKQHKVLANFQGLTRMVYKTYVSDMANKDNGLGDYVLAARDYGIIFRWNSDGEIFMLNRIDVVKDGKVRKETDLLPLQSHLMNNTDIFTGFE